MRIMHSEWRDRLRHWIRTLQDDFYQPLGTIEWNAYRTMEQLTREEVLQKEFVPVECGFTWGRNTNTAGFQETLRYRIRRRESGSC